ncbi:hypothetical protein [Rubinisphaera italica]|uniref:Phage major tail protein 2 n=1 Tax=Rubinisphaera italica TaxID=2527969 RepID=A0A5C5XK17_9PLAN|nr:hypothetical protein [Rubinisphaera italica]TWT63194.1 hypothetical protein Pan54_39470 [Rubinisphaera italica]
MSRSKLSFKAKSYVNLAGTDTEMTTIKDQVTLNFSKNESDDSAKGDEWDMVRGTTKVVSVDFQLLVKADDPIKTALLDSLLNNTPLEMHFLDGSLGTAGSEGIHADFEVMQMNRTEARKEVLVYDCNVKITRGETEGVPEWFIDATV